MEAKDKRVKREIANSNERRRMQSINAGFQKLKRLLPVNEGEKMSKAAILQHAAEFVLRIEREKTLLYEQNTHLRSILLDIKNGTDVSIALKNTDLDASPTIQVNTHINSFDLSVDSMNNNSNNDITDEIADDITDNIIDNEKPNQTTTTIDRTINDTTKTNGTVSSEIAKAAIALPLEVPYISETAIRVDTLHHDLHSELTSSHARKMLKTDTVKAINAQDSAPKGQNLDNICKAIMEIEGDRVFRNERIKEET